MARKFLYVVAGLIVLAIASALAYRFFGADLMRMALVPAETFKTQAPADQKKYARKALWLARPDIANNPALWVPQGFGREATRGDAAIFFVHPTSYLSRSHWNAPINDPEASDRAALFLRGQASAFNAAGEIWAPRYRQATFGAFLTSQADAERALDLAYGDIAAAFTAFLDQVDPARPIVLAGHSQGALLLSRLMRDRVASDPALAARIAAAYVVGWPVSRTTDLPLMGLPECKAADQAGCILSWQSFAEPADPSLVIDTYDKTTGFNGLSRRGTPMVCTNPLTGTPDADAPASANLGTLYPSADLSTATLGAGKVPARCTGRGFLMLGSPPEVGSYVLPGNNYHVYDYSLFWANVRADVARRLASFDRAR